MAAETRRLLPGERLAVFCDGLDERGAGTADVLEHRLAVAGLLPDEQASVIVDHVSPHRVRGKRAAWGHVERLEEASVERRAPVCPAYGTCGGCVLQHLAYSAQLRWKTEQVAAALAAHPALARVPVAPCVPSPVELGYRNQAKYVYGRTEKGRLVLGAYLPRTHAIVDMAGCRVVEPVIDQTAAILLPLLQQHAVEPFDERTRTGVLRYVAIRANAVGRTLVTLVTAHANLARANEIATALKATAPVVAGVVLNVNASPGNALFGEEERTLAGAATLVDQIGSARVELAPRSFFQLNRGVAELAYRRMAEAALALGSVSRVVDAYAGAGGIAFTLAEALSRGSPGVEILAIEENEAATRAAAAFASPASDQRVRFVTADVAAEIERVANADAVVLNPPRAGCAPAVLAAIGRSKPRLVAYLSCHPGTLSRDLALLTATGLVVSAVQPFDMLPHTAHIEALALVSPV